MASAELHVGSPPEFSFLVFWQKTNRLLHFFLFRASTLASFCVRLLLCFIIQLLFWVILFSFGFCCYFTSPLMLLPSRGSLIFSFAVFPKPGGFVLEDRKEYQKVENYRKLFLLASIIILGIPGRA